MNREITQSQREWLDREVEAWQAMGLVGEEQARALLGLYESRQSFDAQQQSKGLLALLALSATLVGFGVLLPIAYNWNEIPPPLKVTAIFGALIATHALGGLLRYRLQWRDISEVVFFLGSLFYGAAIWLLAQIFNISSDNYDALWWWAVGCLPFALLLDTVLLHLLFAGLLALWVGFDVLSLERVFWGMPSVGYSLPPLVAPALWWVYRKNSASGVGIYVPLLAWWVVLQPIAWKLEANPTYFIGAVGSLLLLVAAMHPPRSEMAIPYRLYGIAIVGGTLVPLSFYDFNKEIGPGLLTRSWGGLEQMIPILILAAVALIGAYLAQRKTRGETDRAERTLPEALREIVQRQGVPCGLLVLFAVLAAWAPTLRDAWLPTIAANAAMVAVALSLIRLGLMENRGRPFTAGVAYLLLWAVLRYGDLFGAFGGMLGASLMFFLCGAALFGVALYWRNRKAVSFD